MRGGGEGKGVRKGKKGSGGRVEGRSNKGRQRGECRGKRGREGRRRLGDGSGGVGKDLQSK